MSQFGLRFPTHKKYGNSSNPNVLHSHGLDRKRVFCKVLDFVPRHAEIVGGF